MGYESLLPISFTKLCLCYDNHRAASRNHQITPPPLYKPPRILDLLGTLRQCCFPPNLVGHTCKHRYRHAEYGTAITWYDALRSGVRHFQHKSYNLFTCNCHSFAAGCLNPVCYGGTLGWNMVNVAVLVLFKGWWVSPLSILRSIFSFYIGVVFGYFHGRVAALD
ncbi:hypothetical protein RHMOL_Rhmol11G0099800 [Rhododendron molle]|uniref:Uncharacterized protein n=1 Tax=Rhododendron molle TaxID=49168 RepID=A0ACC0LRH9_RHOML|nr:hypothetical protein RHMOL_Rhmol11G0099800 [Rhododendron molle]